MDAALFTGSNVQRCLGKWNAAVAATMLHLWPDIRKQVIALDSASWVQVTGLRVVPPELQRLANAACKSDRSAKRLGYVASYARHMATLGFKSYVELGRRLHALALSVLPSNFMAVRDQVDVRLNFADLAAQCASAPQVQDDAVGAAIAFLLYALGQQAPDVVQKQVGHAVGAHVAPPLSWTTSADARVHQWDTRGLPCLPYPRAYWAVLRHGEQSAIARLDCEDGVQEWQLSQIEDWNWRWITTTLPFRRARTLVLIGTTGAVELLLENDVLQVTRTLRFEFDVQPPANDHTVGRTGNYVCWHTAQGKTVMLDTHALAIEVNSDTVTLLEDDISSSQQFGAQQNFIYTHSRIVAALPSDQCIVALGYANNSLCIDAFTQSNDWWRLVRVRPTATSTTWEAHVVGLGLREGWVVVDVCEE